jgi:hypothetical protein
MYLKPLQKSDFFVKLYVVGLQIGDLALQRCNL